MGKMQRRSSNEVKENLEFAAARRCPLYGRLGAAAKDMHRWLAGCPVFQGQGWQTAGQITCGVEANVLYISNRVGEDSEKRQTRLRGKAAHFFTLSKSTVGEIFPHTKNLDGCRGHPQTRAADARIHKKRARTRSHLFKTFMRRR